MSILNRHQSPTYEDRVALAPYNFVPLPEKVLTVPRDATRSHDVYQGHSGYFTCELTTSSPTYIRGMMALKQFQTVGDKAFWEMSPAQQHE